MRHVWLVILTMALIAPSSLAAQPNRLSAHVSFRHRPDFERARVVYRSGRWAQPRSRSWVRLSWNRGTALRGRVTVRRGTLSAPQLRRMLGAATLERVRAHGRQAGFRGPLHGRWVEARHGTTIAVTMGRQEIARFRDYDRDGLVDDVLLRRFRPVRVLR